MERVVIAAGYVRTSRDGKTLDGDSLENQRAMIEAYVEEQENWTFVGCFEDAGRSGTDFEREGFQRLFEKATGGEINCIVVKDLSRLGRDYVWVGRYLNSIFPALGIRVVAILDHYDSDRTSAAQGLMLPFRNFINEAYAMDISRKVRSRQDAMRREGLYVAAFAPYGYRKDPEDRHVLIREEETAWVVRLTFLLKLCENSNECIARAFNDAGIPAPLEVKQEKGGYVCGFCRYGLYGWSGNAIRRILEQEVYVGRLCQGKTRKLSHKLRKTVAVPREEWLVCEGRTEPLVDEVTFLHAGRLLSLRLRARRDVDLRGPKEAGRFLGVVTCSCRQKAMKRSGGSFVCGDCGRSVKLRKLEQLVDAFWRDAEPFGEKRPEPLLEKLLLMEISMEEGNRVKLWTAFR